ncbi:hypothetical protein MKX01_003053 [Papaver californicum]|nr:hypothetical protein MKX01_003053 [Papaver californicum]
MGSDHASRKRSRESPTLIDASVECDQASSSRPRKSPRLIAHAQRRELMHAENEKAKGKQESYISLRRSPRLIDQAQCQQLEHSEDKRKR